MTTDASQFKAVIFDLDGTLLNTLPDLVEVTNTALQRAGMPPRTQQEILGFVGNGVQSLISQAVPEGTSPNSCSRCTRAGAASITKLALASPTPSPTWRKRWTS